MNKKKLFRIVIPVSVFVVVVTVTFSLLGALIFNRFSRGIVPTEADVQALRDAGGAYEHVVIIGVDGAGGYFGEMDTPRFDSFFNGEVIDAAVTYTAMSQFPTDSAPNWGSMIHGVTLIKHGLQNGVASSEKYTDTKYPSIFKVYAERHPGAYMSSIVDWSVINTGIIEDDIPGMEKVNAGDLVPQSELAGLSGLESEMKVDAAVADAAIERIKTSDPKILFLHFDCVDSAGHGYGTGKPEYIDAMSYVDGLIARIYDACEEAGWLENTLFICAADHGHLYSGGHGTNSAVVRKVTVAVAGARGNVVSGTPGYVVTQDVAAITFYALGEVQHENWDCSVPKNMFKDIR